MTMNSDVSKNAEMTLEDYANRFRHLLREVAAKLGVDPVTLIEAQTLVIGGVTVSFIHYGPFDPDHLTCCMELGDVREDAMAKAYRVMLEQNASLPSTCGSFGVLPDSGQPVYLLRVKLDAELTCDKLLAVVEQLILWFAESLEQSRQSGVTPQEALHRQQAQHRYPPQGR
jgi:hypothetical protein